jgi:hypothetical protein
VELSTRVYAIHYRELLGAYGRIPPDIIQENVEKYRKYYALLLKEKLMRYPLTLLITSSDDPKTPEWKRLLGCSTKVFESGSYQVFRLQEPVHCK